MIYNYTGFYGSYSICDLEIIKNLVIATEIPENEGTSITNIAEHLATQVCQEFDIDPKHLIWIEHYPQRGERKEYPESYDLVQFNLNANGVLSDPRWTGISKEVVDAFLTTHEGAQGLATAPVNHNENL